ATAVSIGLATWALQAENETRQEKKNVQTALDRETAARKNTRQALARISDRVLESTFTRKTQLTAEDEKFLREILKDYEQLVADAGYSPEARDLGTDGYLRIGVPRKKRGELPEAEAAFCAALENQTKLVAESPGVAESRRQLAMCHNNLGFLLRGTGRP